MCLEQNAPWNTHTKSWNSSFFWRQLRRLAREKETADDNARRIADGHRVDALEHTADLSFVCYLVSLKTLIVKNSFKRKFFKLNRLLVLFATFGWPRQTIPPVESILENLMGQLMAFWNNFLCSRKEEEEPPLVADLWHGDTYNQLTTPPRGKNFFGDSSSWTLVFQWPGTRPSGGCPFLCC